MTETYELVYTLPSYGTWPCVTARYLLPDNERATLERQANLWNRIRSDSLKHIGATYWVRPGE